MITFSPVVHQNNQSTLKPSLNKISFEKLCEIINFDENIEEIIKQIDIVGSSTILKYKKFIEILDKNELNMDIHEGDVKEPLISVNHEKPIKFIINSNILEKKKLKQNKLKKKEFYIISTRIIKNVELNFLMKN